MSAAVDFRAQATPQSMLQASIALERDVEHAMYREAARTSAAFVSRRMLTARPFRAEKHGEAGRLDLLEWAVRLADVEDGAYAEFGVYQGETLGFIGDRIDGVVYGFDSFEGLPEDWFLRVGKGAYSLGGQAPQIPCLQRNYRLAVGDFSQTLPKFLEAVKAPMAFVHIDCCLYSSARAVLSGLMGRIVPGTVAVFDEYFNYPGWRGHEHRALQEFCAATGLEAQYIGFAPGYHSVAVRFR